MNDRSRVPARPIPRQSTPTPTAGVRPSVVLIDGSAMYMATRDLYEGRQLDYQAFVRALCAKAGVQPGGQGNTRWVMWTSASAQNEGQSRFLDFAKNDLRWQVRSFLPADSFMVEPSSIRDDSPTTRNRLVRFDASIAFAIGRLAEDNRLVVVSDSFALSQPMLLARSLNSEPPVLAFFGRALDKRWHGLLRRGPSETVPFVDLDEEQLFGVAKTRSEERSQPAINKADVF
jgi:hypothetical protein